MIGLKIGLWTFPFFAPSIDLLALLALPSNIKREKCFTLLPGLVQSELN